MILVGTNTFPILEHLPKTFLLVDSGPLIDAVRIPPRRKAVHFDYRTHKLNPFDDLTSARIDAFASIMSRAFPAGATTLTKENGLDEIEIALHEGASRLDELIDPPDKKSPPEKAWAYRKVQKLLRDPVLKNVLLEHCNFSLKGIVLARLNRTEIGDVACRILGNVLMDRYRGHIVVSDFGFYAAPHHVPIVLEGRITAQVNTLSELPGELRGLFLLREKLPAHCTYEDALTLANAEGIRPDPNHMDNDYTRYIDRAML